MKLRESPLTFYHKKLAWKNVKIFTQSSFSDFLEILASEATEKPFSKVGEGLDVKGAAADPKALSTLGWDPLPCPLSLARFSWTLSRPALPGVFSGGG